MVGMTVVVLEVDGLIDEDVGVGGKVVEEELVDEGVIESMNGPL